MAKPPVPSDIARRLRALTPARVGLGQVRSALPTRAMLDFELAHARARDAVHAALPENFADRLAQPVTEVRSRAVDRTTYLLRPDLGRSLDETEAAKLEQGDADLALVVADGLSATAIEAHAPPLVGALTDRLGGWRIAPLVLARQARVAIGDVIGAALGAAQIVVLIGERPGLSAPDSLGAYITWAPRPGRLDSERNCVSNIRPPDGLGYDEAAGRIAAILKAARAAKLTGVGLRIGGANNILE